VEKISIKIIPTPATQDMSAASIEKLSRITKIPEERLRDRISRGKAISITTAPHPRLEKLLELIRRIGFSVITGPATGKAISAKTDTSTFPSRGLRTEAGEWRIGDFIENLYEVKDIKQGGMGSVYIVRHARWNSMMAVKSLQHKFRENEEDRALFLKEAETWIDIGFHPNIAACYYVRNIHENPRIFIEYVDGGGLNEWLARRRNAGWDLLLDLMVQVSDGLHHAHTKGLVHRDVKPGNCMITKDGILKVTDFGLTKRRNQDTASDHSIGTTAEIVLDRESITAAGMGTPGYMAPEMWIPRAEVGPQADMYAFGVMFFELCCGRKPFLVKPGEKRDKLALAHVKKAPPRPKILRPDIPAEIEDLILRCLSKHPENRYPTFRDIRQELQSMYEKICGKRFSRETPDEVKLLSDALNNRAVSLMDLNHEDEARQRLREALESDPHHPEATYNLGLLDWLKTKNPDPELMVRLEEVIKTPEYTGRGSYLLGRCCLGVGDVQKALRACEQAISSEDSHEEWLKSYAIALIGANRNEDAVNYLETYVNEFPSDADAMGWLIGVLQRTGRTDAIAAKLNGIPGSSALKGQTSQEIADAYRFSSLTEMMRLTGHTGWITCLALFPRSGKLLTGSRDRTLRIWDLVEGREEKCFNVVGEPPAALWISPDERITAIASAQPGVPVKLLDLTSGRFEGNLLVQGKLSDLGFSPDGKQILTVEQKGAARLWDTSDFKAQTLQIPPHTVAAVAYDASGRPSIFLTAIDRIIRKVNPLDLSTDTYDRYHREQITGLSVSVDGSRILSFGRDKQAILWDTADGTVLSSFHAHQDAPSLAGINLERDLVATYDTKSGIKVWDAKNGTVFRSFAPGDSDINCIAFGPEGKTLLAGSRDMNVRIWDVQGRQIIPTFALTKIRPITKQAKSEKKYHAMVETAKKAIKRGSYAMAYSLLRDSQMLAGYERSDTTLDLIVRLRDHGKRVGLHGAWKRKDVETTSGVMDIAFSPSAIYFTTAHSDHTIRLWSTKTGENIKVFKGHTNLVTSLALSVNGREMISGSDDRSARVWDINTGRNYLVLKGHTESVSSVAYARDGSMAATGSWDCTSRIWRLPEGSQVKILKGHEERVTSVAFGHDSGYLVTAGYDGIIKMWEISSGRVLRDLKGHKDRIMGLEVSPAGDLLISCSMDGTVRVWDFRKGTCLKVLDVSEMGVRTAAFSQDQQYLVTGGPDTVLRIWDIDKGECQREFQGHSREITGANFSSNGRFVVSSSVDGNVMIWELDWDWEFDPHKNNERLI
jgi:WD40 repeat protein/serine/threonine protein kinase